MTIEFNCPHCDKTLKTSDDKAGRQAKCPGCGEPIDVPNPIDSMDTIVLNAEAIGDGASGEPRSDEPPQESVSSDATKVCPMCGETIKAAAIRCRFCREILEDAGARRGRRSQSREMRPFPPGEAISEAWRLYVDQLGLLIGSFLIMMLLIGLLIAITAVPAFLAGSLMDQGNDAAAVGAWIVFAVLLVLTIAVIIYLYAGYSVLQLKVAREEPAELGNLFSGGRFWGRMALSWLLFGLMVGVGSMACIVPGILLAVMFFLFGYALVDEDRPGIACLRRSKELTDGNWGSIFLVFIVGWAVSAAGGMCFYLGWIFTVPFVNLMYAVEYDKMSRQTRFNSNDEDDSFAQPAEV